jgi:hypothetical protein
MRAIYHCISIHASCAGPWPLDNNSSPALRMKVQNVECLFATAVPVALGKFDLFFCPFCDSASRIHRYAALPFVGRSDSGRASNISPLASSKAFMPEFRMGLVSVFKREPEIACIQMRFVQIAVDDEAKNGGNCFGVKLNGSFVVIDVRFVHVSCLFCWQIAI